MMVTAHKPNCPAIGDEDRTCHCWRQFIEETPSREFPAINLERARRTVGEGIIAALIWAKRLKRSKKYGYTLDPESL